MGLSIQLDGEDFFHATDYSVSEDATSVNPLDLNGGVGSISLTVSALENSRRIKGKSVHLSDDTQGSTEGVVGGANGGEDEYILDIDTRLYLLIADRVAAPYNGTLQGLFGYYLGLVGIEGGFIVDPAIASRSVTVPGWEGIVWDVVKEMCVAMHIEIAVVSDNIIIRPVRKFIANNDNEMSLDWKTDDDNRAQWVDIMYYQNQYSSNSIVYPLDRDFISPRIETVEASATVVVEYSLDVGDGDTGLGASLASLVQPVCINSKSIDYNGPSTYTVLDKDGKIVVPDDWNNGGGKITVKVGSDTRSLIVTIKGMRNTKRGPYTIAVPPTTVQESLSSLVIWGAGTFFNKQVLTIPTGNTDLTSTTEGGGMVDNMFINTLAEAAITGSWAVARFVDGGSSIDVSALNVNRTGPAENFNYETVEAFNTANSGTVGAWNTLWAGETVDEFNIYQATLSADEFDNQGFGNIAGARVYNEEAWYRIRTATINDEGVSYSADLDTTVSDFNTVWAETPTTVGAYNALMAGATVSDHAAYPLRKGL